jgi:hypothetical protein
MWLEELIWLWLPVVGGIGLWGIWSMLALKKEVRMLRQQVAHMEASMTSRASEEHRVA